MRCHEMWWDAICDSACERRCKMRCDSACELRRDAMPWDVMRCHIWFRMRDEMQDEMRFRMWAKMWWDAIRCNEMRCDEMQDHEMWWDAMRPMMRCNPRRDAIQDMVIHWCLRMLSYYRLLEPFRATGGLGVGFNLDQLHYS